MVVKIYYTLIIFPHISLMIGFSLNLFFLKLSFQEWTQQVQDMVNTKKFGDIAFRDKDFKNAIEYYSKVFSDFLLIFLVDSLLSMFCGVELCSVNSRYLKNLHLK